MKRRTFLRSAIAASVISLGGISAFQYYQQNQLIDPTEDDFDYQFLSDSDRILLEVLIPVFVSGLELDKKLPIFNVMQNIDAAIIRLPLRTISELRELFDLLDSAFGRTVFANVWLNWQSASSQSISQFLMEWRNSQLDLLQIAYKGLHKLIIGSFFSESPVWSEMGYLGPPLVGEAYPILTFSSVDPVVNKDSEQL